METINELILQLEETERQRRIIEDKICIAVTDKIIECIEKSDLFNHKTVGKHMVIVNSRDLFGGPWLPSAFDRELVRENLIAYLAKWNPTTWKRHLEALASKSGKYKEYNIDSRNKCMIHEELLNQIINEL